MLAALIVACALQDAPQPAEANLPDRLAALAPRAKVAGLAGLQSTSSVRFEDPAARPHRLEATFVFPDRARWTLAPLDAKPGERHVVYRCGSAFFELASQAARATLISDAGAGDPNWVASLASTELRRALFLWPDGFAWSGDGARRSVPLSSGEALVAELGPDGRPRTLSVGGERARRESYRSITWREQRGRWWPAEFELAIDGRLVWRESVDALETQVRVLDQFFLPAELRPGASELRERRAVHVDVPASHWLRVPLPDATEWPAVAELWRSAFAPYVGAPKDGWRLEGGSCVELDERAKPRALLLRFKPGVGEPPKGTLAVREHGALAVSLSGADPQLPAELASLRAALPRGARAGPAYARFMGAPSLDGGALQLYLPTLSDD